MNGENPKKLSKPIFCILIFLVFGNILAWIAVFSFSGPSRLELIFFSVGQGDAILIETPGKNQILIDGGPGNLILEKLGKRMPFFDRTIELIVLSHPESDHLQGLLEVLKNYKVENIIWSGVKRTTPDFEEWQGLIEKERAKIFYAKAGLKVSEKNLVLIFLYPFELLAGKFVQNSNETSLVAKLELGKATFLFTGDIPKSIEEELLSKYKEADVLFSQVLKVAHHGSKSSTSERFLEKVLPKIAVISAGENNQFGHPHSETLEKLEKYKIQILRTDLQGDIKIVTNGKELIYGISNN